MECIVCGGVYPRGVAGINGNKYCSIHCRDIGFLQEENEQLTARVKELEKSLMDELIKSGEWIPKAKYAELEQQLKTYHEECEIIAEWKRLYHEKIQQAEKRGYELARSHGRTYDGYSLMTYEQAKADRDARDGVK